jgi:hypothetical protein
MQLKFSKNRIQSSPPAAAAGLLGDPTVYVAVVVVLRFCLSYACVATYR